MLFGIDFFAFLTVTAAALISTIVVVSLYAFGIRLHALAEPLPEDLDPDTPAHEILTDTGTIIVVVPLNESRRKLALWGSRACYALSALTVLFGIFLIIPVLHSMFW